MASLIKHPCGGVNSHGQDEETEIAEGSGDDESRFFFDLSTGFVLALFLRPTPALASQCGLNQTTNWIAWRRVDFFTCFLFFPLRT